MRTLLLAGTSLLALSASIATASAARSSRTPFRLGQLHGDRHRLVRYPRGGGGGGGSFDGGINQLLLAGVRPGNGYVTITPASPTPIPEPASFALFGAGLAGLLALRRRLR